MLDIKFVLRFLNILLVGFDFLCFIFLEYFYFYKMILLGFFISFILFFLFILVY